MNTRRTFLQAVSACAAWLTFGKISTAQPSFITRSKRIYDPEEVDGFILSCYSYNPKSGASARSYYRRTDGAIKRIEIQRSDSGPELDDITYTYLNKSHQSHRDDGPAFIMLCGKTIISEIWYQNGEKHRENGPAAIYHSAKTKDWYHRGELIRRETI